MLPTFASLTVLDHIIGIRMEALEMCYVLVLWVYHARENDYSYRSEIKSKTIGL